MLNLRRTYIIILINVIIILFFYQPDHFVNYVCLVLLAASSFESLIRHLVFSADLFSSSRYLYSTNTVEILSKLKECNKSSTSKVLYCKIMQIVYLLIAHFFRLSDEGDCRIWILFWCKKFFILLIRKINEIFIFM